MLDGRVAWLALFLLSWPAWGEAHEQRPLTEAMQVAASTCVSATSLAPQVGAWLGTPRIDSELTVFVRGNPDDPRDVAFEIQRSGKSLAQRRFYPAPWVCAQLESTLALAIAMALKVSLRDELLDTLGGVAARPRAREHSPDAQAALSGLLRVGYAILPGTSLGAGLAATHRLGERFALRAEAVADTVGNTTFDHAPGSFDAWLLSGQLSGCALLPIARTWSARACIGVALGSLHVRGHGYKESHTAWLPWVAASNSVGLAGGLSRHWGLDLAASLVVPLNKLTIGVERKDGSVADVRTLPRVGFTVAVGPQYHF